MRPQSTYLEGILRRMYSRSSGCGALDVLLGNTCEICADAVSTCVHRRARGDAYMHILETIYLALIFILRSINELAGCSTFAVNRSNCMVLRTLASWINAIVVPCLFAVDCSECRFDMAALHAGIMFRGLVLVYVFMRLQ